jgi:ribA/ribD-fused uncharacterized protein
MSRDAITAFRGPYCKLSNFWVCNIDYRGRMYSSAEHAYQAAKTDDQWAQQIIATAPSPLLAKKYGRGAPLRDEWDRMKVRVMHDILSAKFSQNSGCRGVLMDTKGKHLVEGNNWGDRFWGESPAGTGDNYLGRLLMAIRDKGEATDLIKAYEEHYDVVQMITEDPKETKTHARTAESNRRARNVRRV